MGDFNHYHIESMFEIKDMAAVLANKKGDEDLSSYVGWLRQLTHAVVLEEISGYEILFRSHSRGWELISAAELENKISLDSRDFEFYMNDFRVQVNNFEVFEWVKEKSAQKNNGLENVDDIPSSHLLIIAALLDLLKNNTRLEHNQNSLMEEIDMRFKNVEGISVSAMEKLFPVANKAMKIARKQSMKK